MIDESGWFEIAEIRRERRDAAYRGRRNYLTYLPCDIEFQPAKHWYGGDDETISLHIERCHFCGVIGPVDSDYGFEDAVESKYANHWDFPYDEGVSLPDWLSDVAVCKSCIKRLEPLVVKLTDVLLLEAEVDNLERMIREKRRDKNNRATADNVGKRS